MFGQPVTAYQRGVQDLIWSISPPHAADKPDGEEGGGEFQLPVISTDADLDRFLLDYFQITLPNTVCCSNHRTPWAAFHDSYFARAAIAVWKASRGFGGKSFLMALLSLVEGLTLRADVNILGGSGIQSKRILEAMAKLWKTPTAPRQALSSEPGGQKQTFIWGNTVTALMASQASVRGPHPQRLRLDEVDEMALDILDAALGQPMSKGWVQSHVVLSSTHQYADGTMTEIMKRATANGWPFYEWSVAQGTRVLSQRGWQPIETLHPYLDHVWTRSGWRRIQHVTRMGLKPVQTLTFDDGHQLQVTGDHRIATPTGWRRAERLSVGDLVTGGSGPGPETDPAMTAAISGGNVSIFGAVWMPLRAVGACDLCGDMGGTNHVQPVGDSFQMFRPDAGPAAAGMVRFQPFRDRPNPDTIGQAVDQLFTGLDVDAPITVGVRGENPDPALTFHADSGQKVGSIVNNCAAAAVDPVSASLTSGSGLCEDGGPTLTLRHIVSIDDGAILVPVWDLGIERDHEFLAEGVVVHNCYRESMAPPHGWLHQAEVDRKRSILTVKMWDNEIEGQEPSSEGRAIETEQVDAAFLHDVTLEAPVPDQGVEGQPGYVRGGRYASGADWAKKKNWTVVVTIRKDVRPMRVVAIKRVQKEPWPKMAGYLNERMNQYGGTSCHDNTGIGQVVHDLLDHESDPFNMVGQKRADLLSEYIAAIEKGDLVWPRDEGNPALEAAYGEHKYATRDDVYKGSKDGTGTHHLPDTFSAGALAWRAATITEAAGTSSAPPNAADTQHITKLAATTARMKAGLAARQRGQTDQQPDPVKPSEAPASTRKPWKRNGHNPGDGESK